MGGIGQHQYELNSTGSNMSARVLARRNGAPAFTWRNFFVQKGASKRQRSKSLKILKSIEVKKNAQSYEYDISQSFIE